MIDIITKKGEKWSFDEDTKRLYKDGVLIPEGVATPVYVNLDESVPPEFSGIYVKAIKSIISIAGNINRITNMEDDE